MTSRTVYRRAGRTNKPAAGGLGRVARPRSGETNLSAPFLGGEFQKWYPLIDARCQHRSREECLWQPPNSGSTGRRSYLNRLIVVLLALIAFATPAGTADPPPFI